MVSNDEFLRQIAVNSSVRAIEKYTTFNYAAIRDSCTVPASESDHLSDQRCVAFGALTTESFGLGVSGKIRRHALK